MHNKPLRFETMLKTFNTRLKVKVEQGQYFVGWRHERAKGESLVIVAP